MISACIYDRNDAFSPARAVLLVEQHGKLEPSAQTIARSLPDGTPPPHLPLSFFHMFAQLGAATALQRRIF